MQVFPKQITPREEQAVPASSIQQALLPCQGYQDISGQKIDRNDN